MGDSETKGYLNQIKPLRLRCHRMVGQLLAVQGDMPGCEAEFRRATDSFPTDPGAWQMLARVLELQGKTDESKQILEKVEGMVAAASGFLQ